MIQIKTLFGEWKEVTKEQAKDCVMLRVYNLSCKYKKNTIKYINENILKGIKFDELISKEELTPSVLYQLYNEKGNSF